MAEYNPQNVKVLIVDDTADNLMIVGSILEEEGYDLYIAPTGMDAERIAASVPLDLILLDVMMPQQDGFTTCANIRKLPHYDSVPIIFLTARIDIDSLIKGFEMGAVDYIRKPFNPQELKIRVRTHAELRKLRAEMEMRNSQLEKSLSKLEAVARTDDLTGLLNRREIERIFEYEIYRTEISRHEFSLIMVDVDLFKEINDTYGHLQGDTVLKEIANQIQKSCRKQDYVARWGGDEFLILLPEASGEEAAAVAERIRRDVSADGHAGLSPDQKVTITCGVSYHTEKMPVKSLVARVDQALLTGKDRGRDCVVSL